jgi:hypothetical protein
MARAPGAAQHEAQRSDALQNRGRRKLRPRNGPGPAVHHFVLHRIRGTRPLPGVIGCEIE